MKILFSPSETKTDITNFGAIQRKSFIFPSLYEKRLTILEHYQTFLHEANTLSLQKLFGYKDMEKVIYYSNINPLTAFTCKAIERYSGVAYDYLDFKTLDSISQSFVEDHVMIFSNLFGPLLAKDLIPDYKVHQGESLNGLNLASFYKESFSTSIDEWIGDECVLDLRAGFYEKFYTLKRPFISMKFLKNGKNVSHFAKAYRGSVLRTMAQYRPKDEKELQQIPFLGLKIKEITLSKFKREYIFESID